MKQEYTVLPMGSAIETKRRDELSRGISMSETNGRHFVVGVVIGLLMMQLSVLVRPVAANNFGGPKDSGAYCNDAISSQCVAEDRWHYINYSSGLDAIYVSAMNYASSLYDIGISGYPSDMVVYWNVAYGSSNDVRAADTSASNGYYAWTRCSSTPNSTGDNGTSRDGFDLKWCKPQLVYFNTQYSHSTDDLKAIACHELGHTMGLRHKGQTSGTTSCMRESPKYYANLTPPGPLMEPNGHDIDYHLNFEY